MKAGKSPDQRIVMRAIEIGLLSGVNKDGTLLLAAGRNQRSRNGVAGPEFEDGQAGGSGEMRHGPLLNMIKVPLQCGVRVQHCAPPVESGLAEKWSFVGNPRKS